ncbi:MAG: transposase [Bacteroidetes bacterium]|nr:transposase [Bacteroidota bacterium]
MIGGYKIRDQRAIHYLTFQVVEWVDIFTRQVYRDIILDSLRYCQNEKRLKVHAYVIMSNHVHCILSSDKTDLSTLVKEFKAFTSKKILKTINEEPESRRGWMLGIFEAAAKKHKRNSKYQVWTHENQPKEIVTPDAPASL